MFKLSNLLSYLHLGSSTAEHTTHHPTNNSLDCSIIDHDDHISNSDISDSAIIENKSPAESPIEQQVETPITVAVAESVTAGALSNVLCSEPGASNFFKGGIVAYSVSSKKEILGIDIEYAEKHNFANPSTTLEMAVQISKMFNARIGLSTTGYSLPIFREENDKQCALDVKDPYAYICLYDAQKNYHKILRVEFTYDDQQSKQIQRATVQTKVALDGKRLYESYIRTL